MFEGKESHSCIRCHRGGFSNYSIYLRSRIIALLALVSIASLLLAALKNPREQTAAIYILQGRNVNSLIHAVEQVGGQVLAQLTIVNGVTAKLNQNSAHSLENHPSVQKIMLETSLTASSKWLDNNPHVPPTGYPQAVAADRVWQVGNTGTNVTVAVLDSGLTLLPGSEKNLNHLESQRILGWVDFVDFRSKPVDPNGHGSHIAGIIANAAQDSSGNYAGIAPGVNLVGVRVLDEHGYGSYTNVLQGIQWILENKEKYNIRVLNLSIVAPVQGPYWDDPINQAVMKAWQAGIVVIAAAGNGGPQASTIMVPGNNPYIITVGAFSDNYTPVDWSDDYLAPFSAAGPTGDGFVKPDLLAPGAHMVSPMHPSSILSRDHEANRVKSNYFSMAGTSQAAAVVSGVAALLLSAHPELNPDQVKAALLSTSLPWIENESNTGIYSIWQQGAGRVNALDAVLSSGFVGVANQGMDISADLSGEEHYAGYSYFDLAQNVFRIRGINEEAANPYDVWNGSYGTWSGTYGTWSGSYGTWSGSYGTWSGSYGTWSGTYGTWSGSYGTWSGVCETIVKPKETLLFGQEGMTLLSFGLEMDRQVFINPWIEELEKLPEETLRND